VVQEADTVDMNCYACGASATKECRTPGCPHAFCSDDGDFFCRACESGSREHLAAAQRKAFGEKAAGDLAAGCLGGLAKGLGEFVKAIFRGL
jgi:hypothetical protein